MKKAFSLTELSIVILIIGILIGGLAGSGEIIRKSRLKTARHLTSTAPISTMKDVVFWFESSSVNSFTTAQPEDEEEIAIWKDINPRSTEKYFAVKEANSHVTYSEEAINSIPGLIFSGETSDSGYFTLSKSESIDDATNVEVEDNKFTLFIVSKAYDVANDSRNRSSFYNGNAGSNGFGTFRQGATKTLGFLFGGISFNLGSTVANENATITSVTYRGDSSNDLKYYINGSNINLSAPPQSPNSPPTSYLFIGTNGSGSENWKGVISEVIFFERKLRNEERYAIEHYLSKKYKIKLSQS